MTRPFPDLAQDYVAHRRRIGRLFVVLPIALVVLLASTFAVLSFENLTDPRADDEKPKAAEQTQSRVSQFSATGFLSQRVPPLRLMGTQPPVGTSDITTGAISGGLDPRRAAQPRLGIYDNTNLLIPPTENRRPMSRPREMSPREKALETDNELGAILSEEAQKLTIAAANSKDKKNGGPSFEERLESGRGARIPPRFRKTDGKKKTATEKRKPKSSSKPKTNASNGKPGSALSPISRNKTPAQQYCFNTAESAADARFAWQAKKIKEMEAELEKRVVFLQKKTAEYKDWLAKRDEFSRKAQEKLVGFYAKMQPDAAAAQLTVMNEMMAAAILMKLAPKVASLILGEIPPERAAKLASIVSGAAKIPKRPSKRSPGRNERNPANQAAQGAPPA